MYVHALLHSQSQHTHRGAGKAMAATHGAEYHSSYDASTKKQAHTVHVFKAKSDEHAEEMKKKLEKSPDVNHVHITKDSGHVLKEETETHQVKSFEDFLSESIVDHEHFQGAHGKKPSGHGNWIFSHNKNQSLLGAKEGHDYFSHTGYYSDAKKKAAAWGKSQGHHRVHVLS